MMGVEAALCVLLLCGGFICTLGDKHSLYYLYTVQSKSSTDGISEFSVVTLLDDTQIDSYSSTDGNRTPKQDWLKKINATEWKAGIDKLKEDGQHLNKILNNQMKAFNASDDHVLQWRNGCELKKHSDGSVSVLNCISEYGYDKQDLISHKRILKKWPASVNQANQIDEEWNCGPGDQKCEECARWLKIYLQYSTQEPPVSNSDLWVFIGVAIVGFTVLIVPIVLIVLIVLIGRDAFILNKKLDEPPISNSDLWGVIRRTIAGVTVMASLASLVALVCWNIFILSKEITEHPVSNSDLWVFIGVAIVGLAVLTVLILLIVGIVFILNKKLDEPPVQNSSFPAVRRAIAGLIVLASLASLVVLIVLIGVDVFILNKKMDESPVSDSGLGVFTRVAIAGFVMLTVLIVLVVLSVGQACILSKKLNGHSDRGPGRCIRRAIPYAVLLALLTVLVLVVVLIVLVRYNVFILSKEIAEPPVSNSNLWVFIGVAIVGFTVLIVPIFWVWKKMKSDEHPDSDNCLGGVITRTIIGLIVLASLAVLAVLIVLIGGDVFILKKKSGEHPVSNSNLGLIIGGAIAGFVFLLAVLVGGIVFIQYKKSAVSVHNARTDGESTNIP